MRPTEPTPRYLSIVHTYHLPKVTAGSLSTSMATRARRAPRIRDPGRPNRTVHRHPRVVSQSAERHENGDNDRVDIENWACFEVCRCLISLSTLILQTIRRDPAMQIECPWFRRRASQRSPHRLRRHQLFETSQTNTPSRHPEIEAQRDSDC